MIALSKAKNFHHKARVYMSDGKLAEATASVREIMSLKFPAGAPEAEDVRNDARALLAKLLVSQSQLDEAMRISAEKIRANALRHRARHATGYANIDLTLSYEQKVLRPEPVKPIRWTAHEMALISSEQGRSLYHRLATWKLGA